MLNYNILYYLITTWNISILKLKEAMIEKLSIQWQEGCKSEKRKTCKI